MRRLLCVFMLFSSVCSAQDYYIPLSSHQLRHVSSYKDSLKKTSSFISFNLGISIPMQQYGEKTTSSNFMVIGPDSTNGKGFANVGFHGNMNGGIFITPSFGVCAKVAYNENTFDESTLNLLVSTTPSTNCTYTINGNYSIWQFMGGIFGNIQLGKTTSVWVQGMAGLINANFPSFSIYNLPNLNYVSWNFTLPNAYNLAYSLSLSFEKATSQNVSLLATLSYTGAELIYPSLTYNYSSPYYIFPPPYTQNTPVTMSFGSLDISVGLLFHL